MTDIKEFLTGDIPTSHEVEEYQQELNKTNEALVASLPELNDQFNKITKGEEVVLETRTLQIAMPPTYWTVFQNIVDALELRERYQIKDVNNELDMLQDNVTKLYRAKTTLNTGEMVISQFMLDTVLGFAVHVNKTELMLKLQSAIQNQDLELLEEVLNSLPKANKNVDIDPNDDPDDDPKN